MFVIASQLFSVLFAAIAISKSYVDFRARVESFQMFIFWVVTWATIVIVAVFPWTIDYLIRLGSGQNGLGTFFGMALVFLFFVVYRMHSKIERMEQNLTKTIQELALKDQWMERRSRK